MPYIVSDKVKLYFEENGRGYPIIFLHEFESDSRAWNPQVSYFARNYRCITYNARGYPPSDVPDELASYGWELSVEDVAAVMRGLSISRAHLVGSSMGGYAALQFGLRYPEKASAIVAAGTGIGSSPLERQAWLKKSVALARAITARGMKAMAPKMAHHPTRLQLKYKDPVGWREYLGQLERHSPIGMSNTLARFQALRPSLHEFSDQFSQLATPILLSVGDEDASCLEANLMLKSVLPNAGLWVCANTGHSVNLEEPSHFNAQMEAFFSAVERGSWRRGYSTRGAGRFAGRRLRNRVSTRWIREIENRHPSFGTNGRAFDRGGRTSRRDKVWTC
jgi:pimeloyl-ACP methyl ester carboxylesterase